MEAQRAECFAAASDMIDDLELLAPYLRFLHDAGLSALSSSGLIIYKVLGMTFRSLIVLIISQLSTTLSPPQREFSLSLVRRAQNVVASGATEPNSPTSFVARFFDRIHRVLSTSDQVIPEEVQVPPAPLGEFQPLLELSSGDNALVSIAVERWLESADLIKGRFLGAICGK